MSPFWQLLEQSKLDVEFEMCSAWKYLDGVEALGNDKNDADGAEKVELSRFAV